MPEVVPLSPVLRFFQSSFGGVAGGDLCRVGVNGIFTLPTRAPTFPNLKPFGRSFHDVSVYSYMYIQTAVYAG